MKTYAIDLGKVEIEVAESDLSCPPNPYITGVWIDGEPVSEMIGDYEELIEFYFHLGRAKEALIKAQLQKQKESEARELLLERGESRLI